jgi:D-alanyl-lipoteichoic acid acyltransferase DltB (MBOAT superfamily)
MEILFYGSLFSIFVAGPIERFKNLAQQIRSKASFSWNHIESGALRISHGLFKKLVIADWLGYFISPVFQNEDQYSSLIRIFALFGYSMQIYLDFAGYSDIAIGTSRLFGLTIMENFDWPYMRSNISDFWKSWHISLSEWIRDYIFFPLSGYSDKKVWLFIALPLVSMGLCGLWHGASWNFLLWGLWHGVGIAILQHWLVYKRRHKQHFRFTRSIGYIVFSTGLTFVFVTVGWLFFK